MSTPYRVEPEGKACETCGRGEVYDIVLAERGKEETQLSTSFSDSDPLAESARERADDLVNDLNDAYEAGRKSRQSILLHLKAAIQNCNCTIAQRDSGHLVDCWAPAAVEAVQEDELAS